MGKANGNAGGQSSGNNAVNVGFATSEEFVRKFGGNRAVSKVLIANNGIAGER